VWSWFSSPFPQPGFDVSVLGPPGVEGWGDPDGCAGVAGAGAAGFGAGFGFGFGGEGAGAAAGADGADGVAGGPGLGAGAGAGGVGDATGGVGGVGAGAGGGEAEGGGTTGGAVGVSPEPVAPAAGVADATGARPKRIVKGPLDWLVPCGRRGPRVAGGPPSCSLAVTTWSDPVGSSGSALRNCSTEGRPSIHRRTASPMQTAMKPMKVRIRSGRISAILTIVKDDTRTAAPPHCCARLVRC
jgi:hypothetical protein